MKLSRLASGIAHALLGILVAAALALLVLRAAGVEVYTVLSGSMEPELHTGSLCLVQTTVPYDRIEAGDVIAFRQPSGLPVTHRVLRRTPEGLETKGDANDVSDGITTTAANYMGKTIGAIPCAGYAVEFLHTARGRGFCLVAVAALLIVCEWKPEREELL